jgi:hypothetical protein
LPLNQEYDSTIMSAEGQPPIPTQSQPEGKPGRSLSRILLIIFGVIGAAILVLVLLPLLNSGPVSPRVKSASNLRQIGRAILLYSSDNNGAYPDSFRTILLSEDVGSDKFVSPLSFDTPAQGANQQAIADQLTAGGHLSYVYLGNELTTTNVTPDTIVAYEKLEHDVDGTNILYSDGRVDWIDRVIAAKIIASAQAGKFPVTMPTN